jgi:hypothetical protein
MYITDSLLERREMKVFMTVCVLGINGQVQSDDTGHSVVQKKLPFGSIKGTSSRGDKVWKGEKEENEENIPVEYQRQRAFSTN